MLVVASLETITARFTRRMHGNLPAPVAAMLARKYGQFENHPHDLRIDTDLLSAEAAVAQISALLAQKKRSAKP